MPLPQITGLAPGQTYYYRVGSSADHLPVDVRGGVETGRAGGWSDIVSFVAFPPAHREPIWAVYGEMGATTDQFRQIAPSIPVLTKDQEDGVFDGGLHAGDYAYDLAPYGGRVGDRFMNLIQPFASRVPYMYARRSLASSSEASKEADAQGRNWQPRVRRQQPQALFHALRRHAVHGRGQRRRKCGQRGARRPALVVV